MPMLESFPIRSPEKQSFDISGPTSPRHHALGNKSICFVGSIALAINNLSGPGMLGKKMVSLNLVPSFFTSPSS